MMRVLEGKLVDSGIKVGIVAARFNEFIVSKLVAGAKDGLEDMMFQKKILILHGCRAHLRYH